MKKGDTLVGEDLPVNCPFCGARLAVTMDPPSVLHGLPMCGVFKRNEPHVFLRKVRKRLRQQQSN